MTTSHTALTRQTFTHMIDPRALIHRDAAQAYDDMPHDPTRPAVIRTYQALRETIGAQFARLIDDGLRITWHGGTHEYASSADMMADVWQRQHLYVRHSAMAGDTFLYSHPMASYVVTRQGQIDHEWITPDGRRLMLNDLFRAVHDIRGHVDRNVGFGPEGEMHAWLQHRSTMPAEALPALWNETRGQAAWTNDFDNHRALPLSERPFAEQKAGMPEAWAV